MFKGIIRKILLINILMFIAVYPVLADELSTDNPYSLTAEGEIVYDNHQGLIRAEGGVVFESADFRVESDNMIIDLEKTIVTATGDIVKIISDEQVLIGNKLIYNYNTRMGSVYQASTKVEDLNLAGDEIKFMPPPKNSIKDDMIIELEQAYLTTCVFDNPHYHVKANSLELYPDNRIIIKGIKFYLGKVMVYYFPSYVIKYDENTGTYQNVTPFPNIGYDSKNGLLLEMHYPYQIGEKTEGLITAGFNDEGERHNSLKHNYQLADNYKWVTNVVDKKEEDDDDEDEYERTRLIDSGLNYRKGRVNVYTGLRYDFIDDETIAKSRVNYNVGRYSFYTGLGYNLTIEDWEEKYGVIYRANKAVYELKYVSGYDREYLPYLSIKGKTANFAGFNTNLSLGLGRVRDDGITANKALVGLALGRSFYLTDNFRIGLNSDLAYHQYFSSFNEAYQVYNTSLTGAYQLALSPTISLKPFLTYKLTDTYGNPVLSDDKEDKEKELKPGVELTYHLPGDEGSWIVGLEGNYDLELEVWDEKTIRLTRDFDCMSAFLEYDTVASGFGFGIEIK